MVVDCTSSENTLRDHAARLCVVRAARRLQHLANQLAPELSVALAVLPYDTRLCDGMAWDELFVSVADLSERAERLIDNSPALVIEPEATAAEVLALILGTEVEAQS